MHQRLEAPGRQGPASLPDLWSYCHLLGLRTAEGKLRPTNPGSLFWKDLQKMVEQANVLVRGLGKHRL